MGVTFRDGRIGSNEIPGDRLDPRKLCYWPVVVSACGQRNYFPYFNLDVKVGNMATKLLHPCLCFQILCPYELLNNFFFKIIFNFIFKIYIYNSEPLVFGLCFELSLYCVLQFKIHVPSFFSRLLEALQHV